MKQNISLSIDKELIAQAKILAAKRKTSISKMLAEDLKMQVEQSKCYDTAKKKALFNLKKGFHLGGQHITSGEELHDRKKPSLIRIFWFMRMTLTPPASEKLLKKYFPICGKMKPAQSVFRCCMNFMSL